MIKQRSSQIRIGIVAGVLLAGGILFLLLPFIALRWARSPFPGFYLDPNLVVNDSGDRNWPAKQGPDAISHPDRLTAVDGMPVADQAEFEAILAGKQVGDLVTYTFVQPPSSAGVPATRNELERTVSFPLISLTSNDLWNQFWLYYLVGLVMLIIGIWTFGVRPQAESAQIFGLFMALGALAVGTLFDSVSTKYLLRVWVFSLSLIDGLVVLLAVTFPHEVRWVSRYPRAKWLVFIPGIVVGVWAQIALYDMSNPWLYVSTWQIIFLLNGIGILVALAVMAYRGVYSPSPLVRQQGRLILVGSIIGFTPVSIYFIGASQGFDMAWFPPTFYIPMTLIYPLVIGYTIIRYRLLDIDIVLRRGLTYTIMTGLLVGAFVLVFLGSVNALGLVIDASNPVLLAVYIVLAVIVFDPLRSRLQQSIDQVFFSQPAALDQLLREYNRELTTAVNANQVADVLLKYVSTGVPETTPQLFLPDNRMNSYSSFTNNSDVTLTMESPLVEYMKGVNGAIDLVEERAWPEPFREDKETVLALNSAVIVPMNNGHELLGWLSLSDKQNKQHFRRVELSYLNALANQSLIGLERANVIRRLEARVSELDMLSSFEQALNFTIEFDDLLELIFINYQRLFSIDDFFISLRDHDTDQVYTAFYLESGERLSEREGLAQLVVDPDVLQVIDTGQVIVREDKDGRSWIAVPLNAGANTLGAIHTCFHDPSVRLVSRQQQLFRVLADRSATALERIQTNQRLQERAQQLEIINEVTLSLATTIELEPLLELILDKAMELLDTEAGTFMTTVPDTGELEFQVARGPASDGLVGTRLPLGTGLAGTAAQTGRPILVNQVQEDKRWFAEVDANTRFQTEAILTVPLLRQNTVLGVLQVINKRNGAPFDDEDQRLLMAFAGQAVVAMENARLLEQTDQALQLSVDELSMLQQLDRDLNTTLDLAHVVNITLSRMLSICKGIAGAVVLVDDEGEVRWAAMRGYDDMFNPHKVPPNTGLFGRVISSGVPYVSGNVHEEEGYVAANFSTHSQMVLPFVNQQKLIGVIAIESDQLDGFETYEVETAVRVANHAAVAIANAILYEQVNEANQAKTEFVSMVSHELKTPMTSMRGYTDLLLSGMTGELSDQQKGFLETIAANINRMSKQIQDLTDISRIESGKLHMEIAPTSIVQVVNETLQTVRGLCDEKGIQLHLQLPEELPPVMADKSRLVQVLTNLLSNACKYSPPDTDVYLTFEAKLMSNEDGEPPQPMVHCVVKDSGYGISEADLEKLFTKFFRSDDPNIRQAKGTGLGLSITRGIIELQGGRIWVESKLGQGTAFHFTTPQTQP